MRTLRRAGRALVVDRVRAPLARERAVVDERDERRRDLLADAGPGTPTRRARRGRPRARAHTLRGTARHRRPACSTTGSLPDGAGPGPQHRERAVGGGAGDLLGLDLVEELEPDRPPGRLHAGLHPGVADRDALHHEAGADLVVLGEQAVGVGDEDAAPRVGVRGAHLTDRVGPGAGRGVGALEHLDLARLRRPSRGARAPRAAAGGPRARARRHASLRRSPRPRRPPPRPPPRADPAPTGRRCGRNPVVSPRTTRTPAPRSRPDTSSSTRPSSRRALVAIAGPRRTPRRSRRRRAGPWRGSVRGHPVRSRHVPTTGCTPGIPGTLNSAVSRAAATGTLRRRVTRRRGRPTPRSRSRTGDVPVLATPRLVRLAEEATVRGGRGPARRGHDDASATGSRSTTSAPVPGRRPRCRPRRCSSRSRAGGSTFRVSVTDDRGPRRRRPDHQGRRRARPLPRTRHRRVPRKLSATVGFSLLRSENPTVAGGSGGVRPGCWSGGRCRPGSVRTLTRAGPSYASARSSAGPSSSGVGDELAVTPEVDGDAVVAGAGREVADDVVAVERHHRVFLEPPDPVVPDDERHVRADDAPASRGRRARSRSRRRRAARRPGATGCASAAPRAYPRPSPRHPYGPGPRNDPGTYVSTYLPAYETKSPPSPIDDRVALEAGRGARRRRVSGRWGRRSTVSPATSDLATGALVVAQPRDPVRRDRRARRAPDGARARRRVGEHREHRLEVAGRRRREVDPGRDAGRGESARWTTAAVPKRPNPRRKSSGVPATITRSAPPNAEARARANASSWSAGSIPRPMSLANDRDHGGLHEGAELDLGAGPVDVAADEQNRTAGLGDQRGDPRDGVGIGLGARQRRGGRRRRHRGRDRAPTVERHVEEGRARGAGVRATASAVSNAAAMRRGIEARRGVLGHRRDERHVVELLQRALAPPGLRRPPAEHEDRRPVQPGASSSR